MFELLTVGLRNTLAQTSPCHGICKEISMKLAKQLAILWLGIISAILFYTFVFWVISFLPDLMGFIAFMGVAIGSMFTVVATLDYFKML